MVYKPLAVRVVLVAGFRLALPVFRYMIVAAVAVVMWESPQGFPRGVGRVESQLYGFPCFPYPGISMACFCCIRATRPACLLVQDMGAIIRAGMRTMKNLIGITLLWAGAIAFSQDLTSVTLQHISTAKVFAFGGIGFAGTTSEG